MDHLLTPDEQVRLSPRVPKILWLGFDHDITNPTHEPVFFAEYPFQRGWTRAQLRDLQAGTLSEGTERSLDETLAMLQSWFFFGVLESAFRMRFAGEVFLVVEGEGSGVDVGAGGGAAERGEGDVTYLDTSNLRVFLRYWENLLSEDAENKKTPHLDAETLATYWTRLKQTLDQLSFWNVILTQHELLGQLPALTSRHEFHGIVRLMTLVGETVASTVSFFPRTPENTNIPGWVWMSTDANDRDLMLRLRARGWCPSIASLLGVKNYGTSLLEYASVLDPTDPAGRHRECVDGEECRANNIDPSTYVTKHAVDECTCAFFKPEVQRICDILARGGIPLIEVEGSAVSSDDHGGKSPAAGATMMAKVVEWDGTSNYAAFSHVWIDGLGSNSETGLPQCQLEVLRSYALETGSEDENERSLFWIDSLCVPRSPRFRKAAIRGMADVYRNSSRLVVVDAGLRDARTPDPSAAEMLLRIHTSSWIQRLWTLQEFLFSARAIWIVYRGRPRNLAPIYQRLAAACLTAIEINGFIDLRRYLLATGAVSISKLHYMLRARHSSKADDETLAIAPLLKLSVAELLELEGPDRMARFWLMVRDVPSNVVFVDGPKLQRPGFRWAPRSLMGRASQGLQMSSAALDATVTEKGLRGSFLVFVFDEPQRFLHQGKMIVFDAVSKRFVLFALEFDPGDCDEEGGEEEEEAEADEASCNALMVNWNPEKNPLRLAQGVALLLSGDGKQRSSEEGPSFDAALVPPKVLPHYRYHRHLLVQFYDEMPEDHKYVPGESGGPQRPWPVVTSRLEKREIMLS